MLAMLFSTLPQHKSIQIIEMNFLLLGHLLMTVDSMHSVIENNVRGITVYVPSQWMTLLQTARKNPDPYFVEVLTCKEFVDWKAAQDTIIPSAMRDPNKCRILWSKLRSVKFTRNLSVVKFHTGFKEIDERQAEFGHKKQVLKAAYAKKIPVLEVKKRDLVALCKEKVIPQPFHHEYESFKTLKGVKKVLLETNKMKKQEKKTNHLKKSQWLSDLQPVLFVFKFWIKTVKLNCMFFLDTHFLLDTLP